MEEFWQNFQGKLREETQNEHHAKENFQEKNLGILEQIHREERKKSYKKSETNRMDNTREFREESQEIQSLK